MAEASVNNLLDCSICLDRFTQPKLLPCQHTYCLSCLRSIMIDDKVQCPQCRLTYNRPFSGLHDFPDNLLMKNLLDAVGESTVCPDCNKEQRLALCEHCEQEICQDCCKLHQVLQSEITLLLQSMNDTVRQVVPEKEVWQNALYRTMNEKKNVERITEEAFRKLAERKKQLVQDIETIEKIQKAAMEGEKDSVIRLFHEDVQQCATISDLLRLKECLLSIDINAVLSTKTTSVRLRYDHSDIDKFGDIVCGDLRIYPVTRPDASLDEDIESKKLAAALENESKFHPKSVDYASMNKSWKTGINVHPIQDRKFRPKYAYPSPQNDVIYCISDEELLVYNLKTDEKTLIDAVKVRHLAVSESGDVLVIVNDGTIAKIDVECRTSSVILPPDDSSNPLQIACYHDEMAILDAYKVKILSADKKRFREFGNDKVRIDETSKMCVDQYGRIYVTFANLKRTEKHFHRFTTEICRRCHQPAAVTVGCQTAISVFSWEGEWLEKIPVGDYWSQDYEYTASPQYCTHGFNPMVPSDVPSDDEILVARYVPILGICIDGDGHLSVTQRGKNQIHVHNSDKYWLTWNRRGLPGYRSRRGVAWTVGGRCPGGPSADFSQPEGVALMPDRRMIVCDTGNDRIQIIENVGLRDKVALSLRWRMNRRR